MSAYHDLRVRADAATEALADKTDHQALANELTATHAWATEHLLNRVALNGTMPAREWVDKVNAWYATVAEVMNRHECTEQEFNHITSINQLDIKRVGHLEEISQFIIVLTRVGELSTTHANIARGLALQARRLP